MLSRGQGRVTSTLSHPLTHAVFNSLPRTAPNCEEAASLFPDWERLQQPPFPPVSRVHNAFYNLSTTSGFPLFNTAGNKELITSKNSCFRSHSFLMIRKFGTILSQHLSPFAFHSLIRVMSSWATTHIFSSLLTGYVFKYLKTTIRDIFLPHPGLFWSV